VEAVQHADQLGGSLFNPSARGDMLASKGELQSYARVVQNGRSVSGAGYSAFEAMMERGDQGNQDQAAVTAELIKNFDDVDKDNDNLIGTNEAAEYVLRRNGVSTE
jgi:hypothetical protein